MQNLYTKPFESLIKSIEKKLKPESNQLVTGIDGSARSVMYAQLFLKQPRQMLIVEPVETNLSQFLEDMRALLPEYPVLFFPVEEAIAVEFSIASFDYQAMRMEVLEALSSGEPCVILTSGLGLRKRLTPVEIWKNAQIYLSLGDEVVRFDLEKQLNELGYTLQSMVTSPGEYSVRGGIVDVYPLNEDNPIRLDFFDTELDAIRYFDAQTQESIESVEEIIISPVTDSLFHVTAQQSVSSEIAKHYQQQLRKIKDPELKSQLNLRFEEHLERLLQGESLIHANAYMQFWDTKGTCLLDYVKDDGVVIVNELDRVSSREQQVLEEEQFWINQEISRGDLLPGLSIKLNGHDRLKRSQHAKIFCSVIQRGLGNIAFNAIHTVQYRSLNQYFSQMPLIKTEVDHWVHQDHIIQLLLPTKEEIKRATERFDEYEIPYVLTDDENVFADKVNISLGELSNGFELPLEKWVVLTGKELFNQVKRRQARKQHLSNAERIKSYNELTIGDYVVHLNHGVGKYTGVETVEVNGIHKDMLAVVYEGGARILIPVDQIQLLQKYVASESKTPKLNKLGSNDWAKTKKKVAQKVEDIADELIELYAKREQLKGYAFSKDTPEQQLFENAFAYVETEDQLRSIQEIKYDMQKSRPMDRLLVGDVGYGKTEVAMRAAFKAVMESKQVAFLVPTTILAQQHYNTLVDRFADFPVNIGLLSRFVSKAQQKETIEGIQNGTVDIVVGTHRVLSQDIKFLDLGLLIVDEEQRFGVKHKERLKQLKSQVDVLTLTATPIPRTLHMSMIGVRDLSVIETPPVNRFPVQTYVMEKNDGAIKSAIERELARGGQCFYLYNRIETIEQCAFEISELVPQARVAFAHGRMTEGQLETILIDFIQGAYDVLVTTTIIETGVDIPNVNTLFIDHADRMGLSTLYQLRGRVGRTNRVAYAYMMYDPYKELNEISHKRLQAIQEFTELGSGFKIAMRDLSIRGAGNLLGKQQSGFIDSVGFDLYSQMLKEAVDVKRGIKNPSEVQSTSIEWDVIIDAYIPATYIYDERQKIAVYKSIQQIESIEDYEQLQSQLIDRFGEFPKEVDYLLRIALIKWIGLRVGVEKIHQESDWLRIQLNEQCTQQIKGPLIFKLTQNLPFKIQLSDKQGKLTISLWIKEVMPEKWLDEVFQLLQLIFEVTQKEESK